MSTRLATLLGRLMKYTLDLKHLEGNKLKVSDALSRLYIVNHKAISLKKSKHELMSTRLATLLGRLMKYTFDLKYLEGNKLKVSNALSRLYIEEKHKINDVIPLNFLLHFTDHQFLKQYMQLANRLYVHKQIKDMT